MGGEEVGDHLCECMHRIHQWALIIDKGSRGTMVTKGKGLAIKGTMVSKSTVSCLNGTGPMYECDVIATLKKC